MERVRGYVFTINNYTEEDIQRLLKLPYKYLVYGKETASTGTPHLQGFVYLKTGKTEKAARKAIGGHVEVQRGSFSQASDYCKKDGDFVENGTLPITQEAKGKLEKQRYQRAWELAKEGKLEEIDADIRVRLYGTLKRIRADYQVVPEACQELQHEWYYGDSGTGKTRKAREENPDAYLKNPNKWWCGYVDQEVVIIDEWSPCHEVLACHLKQWADHHPFAAETKGSSICIRPKKIIITSNYSIDQCFSKEEDAVPLKRRFKTTNFVNFNKS